MLVAYALNGIEMKNPSSKHYFPKFDNYLEHEIVNVSYDILRIQLG